MADVPYVLTAGTIPKLFSTIQSSGKPTKVTISYLKSVGFSSSNDRYLVGLLKALGFVDNAGTPTERWVNYKDSRKAQGVMAEAIREGWSGLFTLYPDAPRKDDEALRNWMRTANSRIADSTIGRAIATFRGVCKLANFDTHQAAESTPKAEDTPNPVVTTPAAVITRPPGGPVVTVNIELQIPATENADIYDKFFAAMKRHLFPDA